MIMATLICVGSMIQFSHWHAGRAQNPIDPNPFSRLSRIALEVLIHIDFAAVS
jgi:hypothetical protein